MIIHHDISTKGLHLSIFYYTAMIRYHLFIDLATLACVEIASVPNVLWSNVKDNVI
jgi:hypothetical protein